MILPTQQEYKKQNNFDKRSAVPRRGRSRKNIFHGNHFLENQNKNQHFYFPKNRQLYESIRNKYHLKDLLNQEGQTYGIDIQMQTYGFQRNDRSYIYSRCNNCNKLKLKFMKIGLKDNPNPHSLQLFDNLHHHQSAIKKKNHLYNMNQIFSILKKMPKNMPIAQFKQQLRKKYKIQDNHIYYILTRFRKEYQSLQTITQYLKKYNANVWTEIQKVNQINVDDAPAHYQDQPGFFMFSLPKMLQNFKKYGDCCYLNIIRGLIKKKNMYHGQRQWEIIALNGLTSQNRFAPFALAFLEVTHKSSQNYVQILKRMFQLNGRIPTTLITPYKPVFQQLIQKLRERGIFNGLHTYDSLEELEQIEKVVSDQITFKYFQDIAQSTTKQEYLQNLQKLYKNVVPTLQNRKILNSLQQKASKMCFSLSETDRYIGMGFKFSANRYMSILVRYLYTHNSQFAKSSLARPKQLYPSIKHFAKQYIKNLLKSELPYIKYELWKLQNFTNISETLLLRNRLKQSVLQIFFSRFQYAFNLNARQRMASQRNILGMKIYDVYDNNSKAVYVVAPRAEYDDKNVFEKIIWRCNCLYSLKSGMPCQHELKVVMMNKGSLLDQINDRWIVIKLGQKKGGRPNKSRRRINTN